MIWLTLAIALIAQPRRQVAITIDDLPYVGEYRDFGVVLANAQTLLEPIKKWKVPVTGFVIGGTADNFTAEQQRQIFDCWRKAGADLGNHTWTHPDLNTSPIDQYEAEILRNDAFLHKVLDPIRLRYFRAPYLHEGDNETTKTELRRFLDDHHYSDAPVTFDDEDYLFAAAYNQVINAHDEAKAKRVEDAYIPYMRSIVEFWEKRSVEVLGRECAQIMLIHSNRINTKMMPDLLRMFREKNYKFISLERALKDPAYQSAENYTGKQGISWIHRWGLAKGMPIVWEPDPPQWILKP